MKLEPLRWSAGSRSGKTRVAWNLSESGVHPLRVEELAVTDADRHALLAQELGYTQTNGTPSFARRSRRCIPARGDDHIEVTNGGSEANCIALWHLVEPGDEVVMMMPNYMQIRGIARVRSARRSIPWTLVEDETRWRPDLDRPRNARDRRAPSRSSSAIRTIRPAHGSPRRNSIRCAGSPRALALGAVGRDLSRRGTRRHRDPDDVGTLRTRAL